MNIMIFFMVIIIIVGLIDRLSLLFISIKIFIDLFFGSVKQLLKVKINLCLEQLI